MLAKVVGFDEAGQLQNPVSKKGGPGPCQDHLIVLCESSWVSPPPVSSASELSTLLLVTLKEMGGILMLSLLFFFASRDPSRNVAIVDALIVGVCVLAITPLLSLYTLHLRRLYPAYLIWGRSVVRLAVAGLLYYLRPREGHTAES